MGHAHRDIFCFIILIDKANENQHPQMQLFFLHSNLPV